MLSIISFFKEFVESYYAIVIFITGILYVVTIIFYIYSIISGKRKSRQMQFQISAIKSITRVLEKGQEGKELVKKAEHAPDFDNGGGSVGNMTIQGHAAFLNRGKKARITDYKDLSTMCFLNDNKPEKFPYEIRTDDSLVMTYSYESKAHLKGVGWANDIKLHFKVQFEDMTGKNKYELEYSYYLRRRNSEKYFKIKDV